MINVLKIKTNNYIAFNGKFSFELYIYIHIFMIIMLLFLEIFFLLKK